MSDTYLEILGFSTYLFKETMQPSTVTAYLTTEKFNEKLWFHFYQVNTRHEFLPMQF